MSLIELISYFRRGGTYEEFCNLQSLDVASEAIEVYMEQPFDIGKNVVFFEFEKTGGRTEYSYNGIIYYNLFDLYYCMDFIEESNNTKYKNLADYLIAEKLFGYAVNDA